MRIVRPKKLVEISLLLASSALGSSTPACGDELEKVLRRSLSPGSIALLAPHSQDKRTAERLRLALASPKPENRGVAARIVGVGALRDLLPDLTSALAKEEDADAAREEIRALSSQSAGPADEVVFAAAKRFSPTLDRDFVRIVARTRGPQALDSYFSSLHDLAIGPFDRRAFFRIATRGERAQLVSAASRVLGHRDSDAWKELLEVASEFGVVLNEPVIVAALRSQEVVFRGETAWYLAKSYCENPPADRQEMLSALSESEVDERAADPELRFGPELLRRVLGKAPVEDEAWIACLETNPRCHLDSDFLESPLLDYLTPREREAVIKRNEANLSPEARSKGKKFSYTGLRKGPGIRLVTGLPIGVARDLSSEGCHSTWARKAITVASIGFRGDGTPHRISLELVPEPQCANAAMSFFLLTSAPDDDVVPDQNRRYIAIFDSESMACNESLTLPAVVNSAGDILRVRANVVPPKLLKRVEPIYPVSSRENHEEGVSIFEAIITPSGCVRDLQVVKSSTPTLDVYGIDAISRWRYKPASFNGRPVSVYLTVTVTYSLKPR